MTAINPGLELSMKAGQMAQDTKSFVIIKLDSKEYVSMTATATLQELCLMQMCLQDFIFKTMNQNKK